MKDNDFFYGISQARVPWKDQIITAPVFYQDVATLAAHFLAPAHMVRHLLPSARMHPIRAFPGRSVVSLVGYEYRHSDIGPYNEFAIAVPITLDRPSPQFTGSLRPLPQELLVYVRHLPVTTEIARATGVELAGYPKTLADISFERDRGWVSCRLAYGDAHVLTLAARVGRPTTRSAQTRVHSINARHGHLLRIETIISEREEAVGRNPSDVRLELGQHPIADELRALRLGRVVGCSYAPEHQAILTPVLESWVD